MTSESTYCPQSKTKRAISLFAAALPLLLAACASVPGVKNAGTRKEAAALLESAKLAHGGTAFAGVRDVTARSASHWNAITARTQPSLSDWRYRRTEIDEIDLGAGTIVQLSNGRSGRKLVSHSSGRVAVWYNAQADQRPGVLRDSAVVADVTRMLLFGPHFFARNVVALEKLAPSVVERNACDEVLAVVRPGFGDSREDRVVLSIDRKTHQLRRVRATLRAFRGMAAPEMEVTFRQWMRKGGLLWASEGSERVGVSSRTWRLNDVAINAGLNQEHPELHLAKLDEEKRAADEKGKAEAAAAKPAEQPAGEKPKAPVPEAPPPT